MLPVSSMSDAANKLRNVLSQQIDDLNDVKRIRIGHPKDTIAEMDAGLNNLNLFFYSVSYDGYPADGLSEDPFYVRLHCLITAVGANDGSASTPSPGENDLRLIGEVMRVLHRQPVISVDGGNNVEIAQLQIVPHTLNLDNLNHIWSTQGDTAYRLSVAYEMALAPIPLAEAVERSSLVGEIGMKVQPGMDWEPLPDDGFGIPTTSPIVPAIKVDASRTNWSPHVCFVYLNACAYTLTFKKGSQELLDFFPRVWVAADANARIDLVWEKWQSDSGWRIVSRRIDIFSVALAMHFGSTNIYASTYSGGVFKSVDGGENWEQKKAGLSDLNVQCIAIDPGTPTTLYAGTYVGGVFKSVDSGENWQQKKAGLSDLNVQFLAIDPATPATVYAGTNGGGVFKRVDSGENWEQKNAGLSDPNVQFLAIDPGTPATVYAGTNGGGVFKSVDSGENWQQKKAGLSDLNVQFIAIDPGTPTTVYAGTYVGGVFKSVDSGENWQQKKAGLSDLNVQFLAIDPATPATVYAGTNGGGVFKSVDSGENWQQKKAGLSDLNVQFLAIDPGTPANVYAGTNVGGVFKSVDGSNTWTTLSRIPIRLNDDVLTIAPDKADSAEAFQEFMPDKLSPGQSMLYAVRTSKSMHDGYVTVTRSNPLLVTVYEAGA
jgi:photosystem II stability/assembly factor-like uncharacterized protein